MSADPIVDAVDRFARDQIDARAIDAAGRVPVAVREGLAELGLFGLTLPEAYGGLDLPLPQVARVIAALARHDRSVATMVGLHGGLGTRGLVAFGTAAQRERYLPELAQGRRIAAFATTEPDAGSDLTAIRTRATLTERGYAVSGQKIYVTNGGIAGLYTLSVAVSTPEARRGLQLVLFEPEDGVVVGAEEGKLGLRGSSTTSLFLDGVSVAAERALGSPSEGADQLSHVLCVGRTLMAAGCVGTAAAALERAEAHAQVRRQFGKALWSLEVVREQLASMRAQLAAMEALVDRTTRALGDEATLHRRSLAAKSFCSDAACEVADLALQLHGGSGYVEETGVALLLRDARITRIFEGANDVLRVRLGLMYAAAPPPGGAGPLARAALAEALRLREEHGLRLAAQAPALWRLGGLVALAEASEALAASGSSHAELFDALASVRAAPLRAAPLPTVLVDRSLAGPRELT